MHDHLHEQQPHLLAMGYMRCHTYTQTDRQTDTHALLRCPNPTLGGQTRLLRVVCASRIVCDESPCHSRIVVPHASDSNVGFTHSIHPPVRTNDGGRATASIRTATHAAVHGHAR